MPEESHEAATQAIAVQRLSDEVRALWRIALSVLTLVLVLLSAFSLLSFFSISRFGRVIEEMGGRPLPKLTGATLVLGDSLAALVFLVMAPIGSMIWLWLERSRPAVPSFVMLCLCVLLLLFLLLVQLALALPMVDLARGWSGG